MHRHASTSLPPAVTEAANAFPATYSMIAVSSSLAKRMSHACPAWRFCDKSRAIQPYSIAVRHCACACMSLGIHEQLLYASYDPALLLALHSQ